MQQDNTSPGIRKITAHSQRQVMDWSLVLASQNISSEILHEDDRWSLVVDETQFERAQQTIKLYRMENRRWKWRQPLPGSKVIFHWGSLFWVLAVIWIYLWSLSSTNVRAAGMMETRAVDAGEWWRLFTAITLHSDWAHVSANVTTGFVFLGLAMARHGAGLALLACYLAGVAGNIAGWLIYEPVHRGLGASGMVMGALGLLAFQPLQFTVHQRIALEIVFRGLIAASLMFVLVGTSPGTDIIAHFGGFVCGAIFSGILNFLPEKAKEGFAEKLSRIAVPLTVIATWWLALDLMKR